MSINPSFLIVALFSFVGKQEERWEHMWSKNKHFLLKIFWIKGTSIGFLISKGLLSPQRATEANRPVVNGHPEVAQRSQNQDTMLMLDFLKTLSNETIPHNTANNLTQVLEHFKVSKNPLHTQTQCPPTCTWCNGSMMSVFFHPGFSQKCGRSPVLSWTARGKWVHTVAVECPNMTQYSICHLTWSQGDEALGAVLKRCIFWVRVEPKTVTVNGSMPAHYYRL